ncbi:MAG: zinc-binding dehydrogenase [Saprospiraceae bacterium]|nr:zinc-binding dehydrogenase [Candidatus Defluviibacterium haderslevense]
MKALVLEGINQPIEIRNIDKPNVEKDFSLVTVKTAGLNHRDLWITKGQYAGLKFPIVLGSDVCGLHLNNRVIINPAFFWGENLNAQSKEFEILGLPRNGSLSEFVSVPNSSIYQAPNHLTDEQVAAIPLAGLTAFRALVTKTTPIKGEKILITGIGGGVALFVLQYAIALGLEVYVNSSSDEKIQKAISIGAKGGVNYTSLDWDKKLLEMCSGVDIIVDGAAGSDFNKLVKVCNPAARICIYGGTQGLIGNLMPQQIFWKQISIFGSTMGNDQEFRDMLDVINTYKIVPIVDFVYAFEDVNLALLRMSQGDQFGKIIIKMAE